MFASKKFKKIIEQMNDLNNNLYELSKKINRLEGDLHELRRKMLYRTQLRAFQHRTNMMPSMMFFTPKKLKSERQSN